MQILPSMIRFAHTGYFYLLLLIPLLFVGYLLYRRTRRRAVSRFGDPRLLDRLSRSASRSKPFWKFVLVTAAIGILVIALVNPQIGTRLEEVKLEGIDIYVALDVSNSMKAEDIKPNRLERARLEIRNLVGRLRGDRVGLIVFAGEAYTQFPLTTDYAAAGLFIDTVDTDIVPVQGTAIGKAIDRAMKSFDFEEPTTKVLIVITDGENMEGDLSEAAERAAEKDVIIYAIGMGSESGVPIPVYDSRGRRTDFKRNPAGEVVMTRLDRQALEKMVSYGKGKYYRGTTAQDELNEIYDDINSMERREFGTKQFTDYESRFQYFVAAALFFLLLELFLSERRTPWLSGWLRDE
jgi:Ca-activated chloride channel family protein